MKDNGDYMINNEGRESSNWSSRPGSDRFGEYASNLQNTEEVHNSCGCNQPISEADREKRIDELDELIHDKLGKYDEDTEHTEHVRSADTDHQTIKNHVTDTPSSATKANNDSIATGSTIGATSSAIGDQTGKISEESNQADRSDNTNVGEPTDCSSDMSINDLASYSDSHNGLSEDDDVANDDVIIVEQVDIIIDGPEQDDTTKE
ncbi:MAG: hypothetical protein LIP08_00140 [Bacteroides sp.]|nr:hypothetical protein [Bacteroides sp.]